MSEPEQTPALHTHGPWQATFAGGVWWVHQADSAPRTRPVSFDRMGLPMNAPAATVCSFAGASGEADAKLVATAPEMFAEIERLREEVARLTSACARAGKVSSAPNTQAQRAA